RKVKAYPASGIVNIDGKESERAWKLVPDEDTFIILGEERVPANTQTKVKFLYDERNIYVLCICDDPKAAQLTRFSRDFISVAFNPQGLPGQWYQFVVHPFNDIHYSYIWKFYQDDELERGWVSSWETGTSIGADRWVAEMKIPLAELKVSEVNPGLIFQINLYRESEEHGISSLTGRIENPEQFGLLILETRP
ncbi:MAG: hypothetical protein NC823_01600, partial [Candidatus Omnitrophica bacterium]|nr:hypothetical protein [Candidatus Omnitrophota bacterium]